jgi:polyhydroxyalkanoate synthesis regulator phasin
MRRTTLTSVLYLSLLFVSGVAVGVFGHRLYTLNSVNATSINPRNPEEFRRRYVAEMRSRLKLTDDQVARLGPILDETRQRHQELMDKHRPEFKAIHDEQVRKIRGMLTDSQQTEYTALLAEREKLRQRDGRP